MGGQRFSLWIRGILRCKCIGGGEKGLFEEDVNFRSDLKRNVIGMAISRVWDFLISGPGVFIATCR